MQTIFINEAVLIVAEEIPKNVENYQLLDASNFKFLDFYNLVKTDRLAKTFILLVKRKKDSFKKIRKSLKLIRAAGGLVRNEENKYLFIFRKGKWDLPKGKLDAGEKTKKAAVREVEEECGIKVKSLGKKICKTWHVYEMNGKVIIKKTSWYFMKAENQGKLVPQLEEGITDARWLAAGDLMMVNENTFPLIKHVMQVIE